MADIFASLTVGERFFIHRKRLGLSQAEYARRMNWTRTSYGKVERDQLEPGSWDVPKGLLTLLPHEEAMIIRRRSGLTQKEVAEEVGLSRHWVSKMETGQVPCERLIGGKCG